MPNFIKSIKAEGVLGRFDIYQEFQEGINVLFGRNGTGKTTLLHILANLLNGDYKRFAFIDFKSIKVQLNNGTDIAILKREIEKDSYIDVTISNEALKSFSIKEIIAEEQERLREERLLAPNFYIYREKIVREQDNESINPILSVAYFPAFRTMIEAWTSSVRYRTNSLIKNRLLSTNFARDLFGSFVPSLDYPSLIEIEYELSREINAVVLEVAKADGKYFGDSISSIFQVLSKNSRLSEESENILEEIDSLARKLEDYPLKIATEIKQLRHLGASFEENDQSNRVTDSGLDIYRDALNIYRDNLNKMIAVQESSFKGIETYLNSVNSFLEGKSIEVSLEGNSSRSEKSVQIKFNEENSNKSHSIRRVLSSGEREIVTLIYAATHMSKQQVVLIDEPEISLHVDWQRYLLQKMSEQLGDRQIIVCTHSPVIGADYEEQLMIFEPKIVYSCKSPIDNELVEEDSEVIF